MIIIEKSEMRVSEQKIRIRASTLNKGTHTSDLEVYMI